MEQQFVWSYDWQYLDNMPRTDMTLRWERDERIYLNLIWVL